MNAINVIHPYKYKGQWVFDDKSKDLDKEPFVAGADTLLDILTDNANECTVIFSKTKFPDAQFSLEKIEEDGADGTFYKYDNHMLWLCPALLKYFERPPRNISFQIKM